MRPLLNIGRTVGRSISTPQHQLTQVAKRNSGGYVGYRELNYDPNRKLVKHIFEVAGGIMYWWIGWNLMTDWRHLIGEFIWPQRSEWKNEELGVPED
ncbi:NADH dehydrogenase [ubiquinone] 1 beta subcomplex subunit 2, mitochondrial [Tyrophagus putrescentiae]|nr:NADH dehydrogenase [ubiquinone] 1 beta subcomplex subunit 2, mitochondrial [Tyrophagus putrescentiae]